MIVKLINYNKNLEAEILHTVIIDYIGISKNNNNDNLTLKLANETGIYDLVFDLSENIEDLVLFLRALDIEIPMNYKLDLSKIELLNRNLKFRYTINFDNNLKFDFLCIPNLKESNQNPNYFEEDEIPF